MTRADPEVKKDSQMSQQKSQSLVWCAYFICLTVLMVGCGGSEHDRRPQAEFTGVVTLDGKPLEEGSIHFVSPQTGETAAVNLGSGGAYSLVFPAVDIGAEYQVLIRNTMPPEALDASNLPPIPKMTITLPKKYTDRMTSDLKAKVEQGGKNTFDFNLNAK